jgi:hypothetical protein
MIETLARNWGTVLWPSFLVACAAELLVFALLDPRELAVLGRPLQADRMLVYALGFFAFWVIGAASSALTLALARPAAEVNRSAAADGETTPAGR